MKKSGIRKIAVTAILAAMSSVLMFINFSIPIMPSFIKVDFSELPALIASFTMGPIYGVLVCLVKNLVNLFQTSTGGVGELSNFIIGSAFVFTAGIIYKHKKNRMGALIGATAGAALMAIIGLFSNYYIVYPIYMNFMPLEAIVGMYKAIYPGVKDLFHALVIFNIPFTFLKGMANTAITFLIYKKISPIIKGGKI
ncbi:MAG: ECF transporter S component [Clostridia bacterium]|nr:ECF transporter S component [Clostridia bacterium]